MCLKLDYELDFKAKVTWFCIWEGLMTLADAKGINFGNFPKL